MSDAFETIRGSGNVFADFGDPDAHAKQLKAKTAAEIIRTMTERGLTVRAAAAQAQVDPADIQRIRNADLSRFTLDRLLRVAHRLGRRARVEFVTARGRPSAA
jgi:predicted XRE-type DNA-binding protein